MNKSNNFLKNAYENHGQKIKENREIRAFVWAKMNTDSVYAKVEKEKALRNIIHFFDFHAWTHEPRGHIRDLYGIKSPTIPFITYGFQETNILRIKNQIEKGEDVMVEKSRDMGVSWFIMTIFLWFFLQKTSGNDFLVGSRKFEYVDRKGAQDTLFEKFRYNLYKTHEVFLPEGFKRDKNDNVGFISNPETESYIRGESNNANFATSGRYKAILADEFSKWEETDHKAWTSMGDSSPCRMPVSTPWGMGRKFANLKFSGAIKIIRLHWTRHPIKSAGHYKDESGKDRSIWYDSECERRKDNPEVNIGQELDIDYLTSGTPYFDNTICSSRYQKLKKDPPKTVRYEIEKIEENKIRLFRKATGRIFVHEWPDRYYRSWEYRYIIAGDVGEGLETGDNSTFCLYDRVKNKDVAWFAGRLDTDVFALLLKWFAVKYHDAWVAPENNAQGHAVIQKLKSIWAKIKYEREYSKRIDVDKEKLGWNTNVITRHIMCADLREAVHNNLDGILDEEFFLEAETFIYNINGKPEAAAGNLDDRVIGQAIKIQTHKWLPPPKRIIRRPDEYYHETDYKTKHKDKRLPKRPKGSSGV